MTFFKTLSPPKQLIGNTPQEIVDNIHKDFYSIFMKKDSREFFNNKFIFFSMDKMYRNIELPYPERFVHICSIKDNTQYNIFPCNNDITFSICKSKCSYQKALSLFYDIGRIECPYRMSRIHWIPEVISLYNQGSPYIKKFSKQKLNRKTNKMENIIFIRYNDNHNDYVVLLDEDKDSMGNVTKYRFKTAYPVFLKKNKIEFDNLYKQELTKSK